MNPKIAIGIVIGVLAYGGFITGMIMLSLKFARGALSRKVARVTGVLTEAGATRINEHGPRGYWQSHEAEYELQGRRVFCGARYVSRSYVRVSLRINGGPFPQLYVFPERVLDKVGKAIGLNREVQTGDAAFDKLAYLDSVDSDANIRRLMESQTVRDAVGELLKLGYRVQFGVDGVQAFQVMYALRPNDPANAVAAVAALGRVADAIPTFSMSEIKTASPYRWQLGVQLIAPFLVGMFITGVMGAGMQRTIETSHNLFAFVGVGGLAWALYVFLLSLRTRGHSYAIRVVLVGAAFALLGIPGAAGLTTLRLNQWLDDSAPVNVSVRVDSIVCGKKNGCNLRVESWTNPTETTAFHGGAAFKDVKVGDVVTVTRHAGKFGWEWASIAPP